MKTIKLLINFYWGFLIRNRSWFFAIVLIFLAATVSGFVTSQIFPGVAKFFINAYSAGLDKNLKPGLEESIYIFKRNLVILAIGTFGGFFFGIVPVVISFLNGYLLGLLLGFAPLFKFLTPFQLLLLLLPHGIFEYIATFLGLGIGLRLGLSWIFNGKGKRRATFVGNLRETIQLFVLVVALLFLAALIEGNLTAAIACVLGKLCR